METGIEITVDIPEELQGNYSYVIIREHNGEMTFINPVISPDGKTLTFISNRFSVYAVAFSEKPADIKQSNSPVDNDGTEPKNELKNDSVPETTIDGTEVLMSMPVKQAIVNNGNQSETETVANTADENDCFGFVIMIIVSLFGMDLIRRERRKMYENA